MAPWAQRARWPAASGAWWGTAGACAAEGCKVLIRWKATQACGGEVWYWLAGGGVGARQLVSDSFVQRKWLIVFAGVVVHTGRARYGAS